MIRFIGILIMILGIVALINPEFFKQILDFFKKDKQLYWNVGVKFLFGIVLLLAAYQCKLRTVIMVLGIIYTVGGAVGFALGINKLKAMCEWWEKSRPYSCVFGHS